MNQNELTKIVKDKVGLDSMTQTKIVCNAVLDTLTDALQSGDSITFTNFGNFKVVKRGPRTGRNPRTGESIAIPASTTVKFTPAKALRESL